MVIDGSTYFVFDSYVSHTFVPFPFPIASLNHSPHCHLVPHSYSFHGSIFAAISTIFAGLAANIGATDAPVTGSHDSGSTVAPPPVGHADPAQNLTGVYDPSGFIMTLCLTSFPNSSVV